MKKIFYSIAVVSAMMFASCSEDRGRTYETADANQDENVNQSHIRGNETAMGTTTDMSNSDAMWRSNSERIAGQMATDMRLDTATQNQVQQVLYERERRLSELEYNYNETNRMGGQVAEDVDNTATTNKDRYDMDGGTMTDTRTNMNTNAQNNAAGTTGATDLDTERERIMQDTDRELQSILTQEQYNQYQEKRANYWGMSNDGTNQLDNSGSNNNLPRSNSNAGNGTDNNQ
ncbi:hypothetical protein [uncultured Pontibacter sp.]|uniref:hypothetical protein n=1 Tax=uncultured Pontibacter sp. TaxID=453356 RepID=UPI00260193CB|nr:hypothetical protein [uncultured Pontibacter sp.]